jgi:hypothetical protein
MVRDAVHRKEAAARTQALAEVSNVLDWLHFDPPPTIAELREWVGAQFKRATATNGPYCAVRTKLKHYYGTAD